MGPGWALVRWWPLAFEEEKEEGVAARGETECAIGS